MSRRCNWIISIRSRNICQRRLCVGFVKFGVVIMVLAVECRQPVRRPAKAGFCVGVIAFATILRLIEAGEFAFQVGIAVDSGSVSPSIAAPRVPVLPKLRESPSRSARFASRAALQR